MKRSRTSSASTSSTGSSVFRWPLLMLILSGVTSSSSPLTASAFQLGMEYKPPVKSSVKKLYDQRYPHRNSGEPGGSHNLHNVPNKRRSWAKSAFAGTLTAPPTTSVVPESFERRMRNLVDSATRRTTATRQLPPNVYTIDTLQDFKEVVADETEKMVAVRFFAPWCKACKAVAPHFYRMAVKNPNTIFVDVPVTNENASLHQGLGVPSLPFGHIYHPTAGLVEELRLTRKLVPDFEKTLQSYLKGSCDIPPDF